ncbi:hypothetical protein AB0K43_07505 [Kitasatospora sp. NPDC049258]|uniref:hypothetical protein n=1 Tax=Kitasatospora sp. NPDC049258 TaxID=3155394 RepID=UPI00341AF21A
MLDLDDSGTYPLFPSGPLAAIYLRCYPFDQTEMACHFLALQALAEAEHLPNPLVYFDNGRRAADGLPRREALLRLVAAGTVGTVLVPGPFIFALDDREAAEVVSTLRAYGCRLVELPDRADRCEAAGTR